MMQAYTITVVQISDDEYLNSLDRGIAGEYLFLGKSPEDAIDTFHNCEPIKVLDDFQITCKPSEEDELKKRINLAKFGVAVLAIMEDYNEWNADTLAAIEYAADRCGLVQHGTGEFKVSQEGKL